MPIPRGCVAFADRSWTEGAAFLAVGWGDLIFLLSVQQGRTVRVLGAVCPNGAHPETNPVTSVSLSSQEDQRTSRLVASLTDGTNRAYRLLINTAGETTVESVEDIPSPGLSSFTKSIGHKDLVTSSAGPGLALSACSSCNGAYDLALKRTSRSVTLLRRFSIGSVSNALRVMIDVAARRDATPLLDLAIAIAHTYTRESSDAKLENLPETSPLAAVISRLTSDSVDISAVDPGTQLQLAIGLHHLHSRIDSIAAAHPRARLTERRALVRLMNGNPQTGACAICNAFTTALEDDCRYARCDSGHVFEVCQISFQVLGKAVRCNFCLSATNTSSDQIALCPMCRIGLTSSLVV